MRLGVVETSLSVPVDLRGQDAVASDLAGYLTGSQAIVDGGLLLR